MNRLGLTGEGSRKRTRTDIDLTQDESNLVYKTNPFCKDQEVVRKSDKADPASLPTMLEERDDFRDSAHFIGTHSEMGAKDFDAAIMEKYNSGVNSAEQTSLTIGTVRISLLLLYDDGLVLGTFVPVRLAKGIIKAVIMVREFDEDNLTSTLPVPFILHSIFRMNLDFGLTKIRHSADRQVDGQIIFTAWTNTFKANIKSDYNSILQRRVATIVNYVKNHGIVKCHAMSDEEVVWMADAVEDEVVVNYRGRLAAAPDFRNYGFA